MYDLLTRRRPSSGRAGAFVAVACLAALWGGQAARAQVSAEESAKKLKPADGLEATLWAAEPMVHNPTTIDVDSRGRVWVTEGLNYRLTRGGNRRFSRIEEADRIKILEDTDGDGKADKMTVFADRVFPVPMGIAVEENWSKDGKYLGCKVYVGNSPDLLVLEDTDGDDKADKRYALLTGFGGVDSDHGVHGPVLFLDGKLYFTHGDGCCSVQQDKSERQQNFDVVDKSGRHVSSSELANTLRVNRDGTQFEIIADRQRNNYETCLNSFGNEFTSDNDDDGNRGSRVIWVVDGGKYGYRTQGSARHWGEDVPGMIPKLVGTGNGSPCGVMVYEGDKLPEMYRGAVLEAEAGPRVINAFPLTRKGAAFRTEHRILLASDDPWFRPVDVTAAPDGSVFISDWYDAGVGGHAFSDQNTGRIYRVAAKGAKPEKVRVDFSTTEGLVEALKSPVVATQDVARRLLIARGPEVMPELHKLLHGGSAQEAARAMWVAAGMPEEVMIRPLVDHMKKQPEDFAKHDPRLRELVVRILGRDVSRVGKVEDPNPRPPAAAHYLDALRTLADDPDAGVRRELILALRDVPTAQAGAALKKLAASWDGQDRWYLEALGMALRKREPGFLAELFDGKLYGSYDARTAGQESALALPPYFPTDRNEAYLTPQDRDLPANALSKTIGLMWEVHRAEVLPLLTRIMPSLKTPELQQAADDVIMQVTDPAGAPALAELATAGDDPVRRRQALTTLGRKLETVWGEARGNPAVVKAIEAGLDEPQLRASAVGAAAASGDPRYAARLETFVGDEKAGDETRVAAVEALGRVRPPKARETLDALIAAAEAKKASNPTAEAAVRTLPRLGDAKQRLGDILLSDTMPLGLRREALRTLAQNEEGARGLIGLARDGKLADALKVEATVVLNASTNRGVRDQAAQVLPLPKTASGKPLPPIGELIRRDGDAERGRSVFFRQSPALAAGGAVSCGGCHRVQGRGQWVGPDLSTIGSKYGRDELLRSILNPSAAIGYNYRTVVLATNSGQILSGLPVEDTPARVVLKTAEGKRVTVPTREIDERSFGEVSLMPEGLANTLSEQDLVDLLVFLSTLKQPVSIVGEAHAVGPVAEGKVDPAAINTTRAVEDGGRSHAWRRLTADAEGNLDVTPLSGGQGASIFLYAPVVSSAEQSAQLVLDTKAGVTAWLGGKKLNLPQPSGDATRSVEVKLPKGRTDLVLRVPADAAGLVATFVSSRPLEFTTETRNASAR